MGTYRTRQDPLGFTAQGASWSDLFETCAQAMFSFEYDTSTVGFEREVSVLASAGDLAGLLSAYLNELLRIVRAEQFFPGDFIVVELGEPPVRRYGDTSMHVRGTARGRLGSDGLRPSGRTLEGVGEVETSERRRKFKASVGILLSEPTIPRTEDKP